MIQERSYSILKEYLKVFVPVITLIIITAVVVQKYSIEDLKKQIEEQEAKTVSLAKHTFESNLQVYVSDALILARMMSLHIQENLNINDINKQITKEFLSFLKGRNVYDQVRLIDNGGMERVRINLINETYIAIPENELQSKKHRPYFEKGINTKEDVYISEFDLNIEQKKIEFPLKPMIRFVAPIISEAGKKNGVIVLNFLGELLLDMLRDISEQSASEIYLVNENGYWLLGPDPDSAWGFMLSDRNSSGMHIQYPQVWKSLNKMVNGMLWQEDELYLFTRVSPTKDNKVSNGIIDFNPEEQWFLVTYASAEKIAGFRLNVKLITCVLIILVSLILYYSTKFRVNRKQSEQAIHLAKKQLELSFDSMNAHISILDLNGKICFANKLMKDRFAPMFGGDIIGLDYRLIYCGTATPDPQPPCAAVLSGSDSVSIEAQLPTMKGWQRVSSFPVHDINQDLIAAVSIVEDITERKRVEEELVESKEKWKNLSENVPDIILTIDKNFNIIFLNHTISGRKKEDLIGTSALDTVYEEDKDKAKYAIRKVFQEKESFQNYEVRSYGIENRLLWFSCRVTPLISNNQVIAVTIIATDITALKNNEKSLREYADTQKILFREVNHRVKNNLSALISILHSEEEKADRESRSEVVSFLKDFESRLLCLAIVHEMLSAEGWNAVQLDKLIAKVITEVGKSIRLDTKITLQVSESDIVVDSNTAHNLTLVINELTLNSLKHNFMNRNELNVSVEISIENSYIKILYRDDGPGYPEQIQLEDLSRLRTGFEFIEGIVKHSLAGNIEIKNDKGAVTAFSFLLQ